MRSLTSCNCSYSADFFYTRDESVSEKEARLDEINSNISDLEHKLELMVQLLQTTESSTPSLSIKRAKPEVTKEQQPSEEEGPKSITETTNVEEVSEEGKDESKSESASSVAAMVDEEESPATLADESHVELDEEELVDEAKDKEFDDELKEEEAESKGQEIEEAGELEETAMEEGGESTEVVRDEQSVSSEGVSKPKAEAAKAQGVKPSSQQGAPSQVVIMSKGS